MNAIVYFSDTLEIFHAILFEGPIPVSCRKLQLFFPLSDFKNKNYIFILKRYVLQTLGIPFYAHSMAQISLNHSLLSEMFPLFLGISQVSAIIPLKLEITWALSLGCDYRILRE